MRQGWRWFGPDMGVGLDEVRQAGATDVVSALHQVPIGTVWTDAAIAERKNLIETTPAGRTPLTWSVIESIPIPDAVKRKGGAAKAEIEAWIASLEAAGRAGIKLICYNFMPVVDWCRTDLDYETPTGSTAMRFDQEKYAVFELCILQRPGAERDYTEEEQARAKALHAGMSDTQIAQLTTNIAAALPGSTTEPLTIAAFRDKLEQYRGIDAGKLRQHLIEFLTAVTPAAEALGVTLTLHPDDPPRPLFGLPRVASTEADFAAVFEAVPSPANGLCFCTGSFGIRKTNNLPLMIKQFINRVNFLHLRNIRRSDGDFCEVNHLEGDVDMYGIVKEIVHVMQKRGVSIPMRPDHGLQMLDDLHKKINPGYSAIGRLKGLAELRGLEMGIQRMLLD